MPQNCSGLSLPRSGISGIPTSLVITYDGSPLSNIPNIVVGGSNLNDVISAIDSAIGSSSAPTTSTVTYDGAYEIDCITFPNPSNLNDVINSIVTQACTNATNINIINEELAALCTSDIDICTELSAAACEELVILEGTPLQEGLQSILGWICDNKLAIADGSQDEHNIQWEFFGTKNFPIVQVGDWILYGYDQSTTGGLTVTIGDASGANSSYAMQKGYLYQSSDEVFILNATRDVYIDIVPTGSTGGTATLLKTEVPNGQPEPAVGAGHIRVWKLVTDATSIVSSEDRRNWYNQDGSRLTDNSIKTRHILDANVTGAKLEDFGTGVGSLAIGLMDMSIDSKGRVQSYVDNTNIAGLVDNDVLVYNATSSKWENVPFSSVSLPTGTLQGQTLGWNNTTSVWDVYSSFRLLGSSAVMGGDSSPNTTFQFGVGGTIGIENATIAAPTLTAFGTGTLPANTYYVAISYEDINGNESGLSGETNIVIDGTTTTSFTISFIAPPMSSGVYKIWVSTTSGSFTEYFSTTNGSSNPTILYDGSIAMTAGVPSSTNSFSVYIGGNGGYGYNDVPTPDSPNSFKSNGVATILHKLDMAGLYTGASLYGIKSSVNAENPAGTNVGGWFTVTNPSDGGLKYVLRLEDGIDNTDKYLKCIDADGHMVFASGTGGGGSIATEWNGASVESNTSTIDFKGDAVYQGLTLGGGGVEFYFDMTASNVGSVGEGIFKQKTAPTTAPFTPANFEFKKLVAGTNISFTTTTDTITINSTGGGGGGETNTMSNVGTGIGEVYKQKLGVDFELRTIKAGSNISIVNNADDIEISGNAGTVTSVAFSTGTTGFVVSGSPITSSGTIILDGTLSVGHGGTGLSTVAAGDILYASALGVYSTLSAGNNGEVLTLSGGLPVWATASSGGLFTEDSVSAGHNIYGGTGAGADLTSGATEAYMNFLAGVNAGNKLTLNASHSNIAIGEESLGNATTGVRTNIVIGVESLTGSVTGVKGNVIIGYDNAADVGNDATNNIAIGSSTFTKFSGNSRDNIILGAGLENPYATASGTPLGSDSTAAVKSRIFLVGTGSSYQGFTRHILLGDGDTSNNTDIAATGNGGGIVNDYRLLVNGGQCNPYGLKPQANLHVVAGGDGSGELSRDAFIITQAYDQTDYTTQWSNPANREDVFIVNEFGHTTINIRGTQQGGIDITAVGENDTYIEMLTNSGGSDWRHKMFLNDSGNYSEYNIGEEWAEFAGSTTGDMRTFHLGTAGTQGGTGTPTEWMKASITGNTGGTIDRIAVEISAVPTGSTLTLTSPSVIINGYTMPAADGGANTVLQTDGAGNVSWATVSGGGGWTVVTKTSTTSSAADGEYCLINSIAHSITLPAPTLNARIGFKQIAGVGGVVEILTSGATVKIDGLSGYNVAGSGYQIYNQWDALTLVSNGTDWFIEA